MNRSPISTPLIVDQDLDFLQSIKSHPLARTIPPLLLHSEAQVAIEFQDPNRIFSGLFLNPGVSNPLGIPLVRAVLKSRPTLPLYFITDGSFKSPSQDELSGLMIRRVLNKPVDYAQLIKVIQDQQIGFNPEEAMRISAMNPDQVGCEASAVKDVDFLPIRASCFFAGTTSYFDVYVRLGADKYLKILQAGDAFSPDRIASYLKKVTHLFLRKQAQENYLSYCDQLTATVLKRGQLPVEVKSRLLANQGQETVSFLKHHGMDESAIIHAASFVSNVKSFVNTLRPHKHSALSAFLLDLEAYEHGVATTMIASLLMQPLTFEADKSVQVVGLASLFHDIGMQKMPEKLKCEDADEAWSEEETKQFWTHPTLGAAMLAKIGGLDVIVIQAVEQHHERRTRTGFPNRIGAGSLNRVAEIVGISQEFVNLIQKSKKDPLLKPLEEMELRVFNGFSSQVCQAFRSVFMA